jgi:hypothetical protein
MVREWTENCYPPLRTIKHEEGVTRTKREVRRSAELTRTLPRTSNGGNELSIGREYTDVTVPDVWDIEVTIRSQRGTNGLSEQCTLSVANSRSFTKANLVTLHKLIESIGLFGGIA